MKKITATSTLPRITKFIGTTDYGPCDGGPSAICTHCGSGGRYIHAFECEDGSRRGAMSGCIQLFPIHPFAKVHMDLVAKEEDLKKRFGKDEELVTVTFKVRTDRPMPKIGAVQRIFASLNLPNNIDIVKIENVEEKQS